MWSVSARCSGPASKTDRPMALAGRRSGAAAVLAALMLAGCGSAGYQGGHLDQRGQTTPDDAVNMSAAVSGSGVIVSPARLGAGQVIVTIVNTGTRGQSLVARPATGHGATVRLGEVPAGSSIQTKVELRPGDYLVGSPRSGESAIVSGHRALTAARLTVGPFRDGGDADVEQP